MCLFRNRGKVQANEKKKTPPVNQRQPSYADDIKGKGGVVEKKKKLQRMKKELFLGHRMQIQTPSMKRRSMSRGSRKNLMLLK